MMTLVVWVGGDGDGSGADGINCRNANKVLVRRLPEVQSVPCSVGLLHCRPTSRPPNCIPRYLRRQVRTLA